MQLSDSVGTTLNVVVVGKSSVWSVTSSRRGFQKNRDEKVALILKYVVAEVTRNRMVYRAKLNSCLEGEF